MFKIGDKVRCIRVNGLAVGFLTQGAIYEVESVDDASGDIRLVNSGSTKWAHSRFELVVESHDSAATPSQLVLGAIERVYTLRTKRVIFKTSPNWVGGKFSVSEEKRLIELHKASKLLDKMSKPLLKGELQAMRSRRRMCGTTMSMRIEHIKTKKSVPYSVNARTASVQAFRDVIRAHRIAMRRKKSEVKFFKRDFEFWTQGGVMVNEGSILALFKSKSRQDVYRSKKPKDRVNHVGIELEFVSHSDKLTIASDLASAGLSAYVELKEDGSIRDDDGNNLEHDSDVHGHELCILAPESRVRDIIERVTAVLRRAVSWVNQSCGMHVHVDCRQRDVETVYNNLCVSQGLLYRMNPKSRLSGRWCKRSKRGGVKGKHFKTRYLGVNPMAYREHKTIEVRIHSGTLNADKIVNWVKLLTTIADQPKMERFMRSPTALKRLRDVSNELCTYVTERVEKFKAEHMTDVARRRHQDANAAPISNSIAPVLVVETNNNEVLF